MHKNIVLFLLVFNFSCNIYACEPDKKRVCKEYRVIVFSIAGLKEKLQQCPESQKLEKELEALYQKRNSIKKIAYELCGTSRPLTEHQDNYFENFFYEIIFNFP